MKDDHLTFEKQIILFLLFSYLSYYQNIKIPKTFFCLYFTIK